MPLWRRVRVGNCLGLVFMAFPWFVVPNTCSSIPIPTFCNARYDARTLENSVTTLTQLADAYGVATRYQDGLKQERKVPTETLGALLAALGARNPLGDPETALRQVELETAERLIDPVAVAWDGALSQLPLRAAASEGELTLSVHLESDETLFTKIERSRNGIKLSMDIPLGRHRATLRCQTREAEFWIISAPSTCPRLASRHWGMFAPTYALHSKRSQGIGDLGDLRRLGQWMQNQGGGVLATLPLCAAFLGEPLEISPYAPVSRLFWNEIYLELDKLAELPTCAQARQRLESSSFRSECARLLSEPHVDYARVMKLKKSVLAPLAEHYFENSQRWNELQAERPELMEYARFRAARECGVAPDTVVSPESAKAQESARYHAYAQLSFEQQLRTLQQSFRAGPGLYLDVPVGVHRDGYDAWKHPTAFMPDTAAGAPPDALFTGGQNWGFAPAHPQRTRESGYEYLYSYLHALATYAGVLRIDHVMGLHRIFAIPDGAEGKDGTYVHFHPEEQWAILTLVAHRCGCAVVGEDLGTVPSAVRKAMDEHNTLRMFVGLYSFGDRKKGALKSPNATQVGSLGTHDTPTLAGFLEGLDIDERFKMGLITAAQKKRDHLERRQLREALGKLYGSDIQQIHRGLLKTLASSDAAIVLATLEDCWSERLPQNVPGTGPDWPNWKRRMSRSLEQIERSDHVERLTRVLAR